MANGYFQLIMDGEKGGIQIFSPTEGGEKIRINEVAEYLTSRGYIYDLPALNKEIDKEEDTIFYFPRENKIPEEEAFSLVLDDYNLQAIARFYAPEKGGGRIECGDFIDTLKSRKIVYGIKEEELSAFFNQGKRKYCTDIIVAEGIPPRHGSDARVEYHFDVNLSRKPSLKEDGSVDFFNLNTVCHCEEGELLAEIIPADKGEPGTSILGTVINPREVKDTVLKFGRKILLSEDKLRITSQVNGHVMLIEGKVFVSDVLEVENVDNSTGNINHKGSVQVNGNVCSNFEVRAQGNIVVKGVVEGAVLVAGGDIIIERGVNGMTKGVLASNGNIVSKFLENTSASAAGYVFSDSILHSKVYAGTEINVSGKKGFITGGQVSALNSISVKTLGSQMGAATIVEVGVRQEFRNKYHSLQKEAEELENALKSMTPMLEGFEKQKAEGIIFDEVKEKNITSLQQVAEQKKQELANILKELEKMQGKIEACTNPQIVVAGEVYPGTKMIISDASMVVQNVAHHCRFVKKQGDVKMVGF